MGESVCRQLSLVWGVLLLLWPLAGAVVMTLWLGAYALLFGSTLLLLALKLRREARRPQAQAQGRTPPAASNPS